MINDEEIKFIRQKCIEANPSILDLVFGCEVKHEPSNYMGIDYRGTYLHEARGYEMHLIYFPGSEEGSQRAYSTTINIDDFKIIGREIHLADVLLAINNTSNAAHAVTETGAFLIEGDSPSIWEMDRDYNVNWNLSKDSLSDQSPETIDFIFNLLSPKS